MINKREKRRRVEEPLKKLPDYRDVGKSITGEVLETVRSRIYFVDENGKGISVTANGVEHFDKIVLFRGVLPDQVRVGTFLRTLSGPMFEVIRIECELRKSIQGIPRIFIVVKEVV